jgi:hypothetical protein
MLLTAP